MGISLATLIAIIGISLITVEIVIFGFSTIFLLFIAIGCLLSSLLLYMGIIEQTLLTAFLSVATITAISVVLLWKPLKRLQEKQQHPDAQPNVFDGVCFNLEDDLSDGAAIKHRYSGIEWEVRKLVNDGCQWDTGTLVEVTKTGVGKLWVKKKLD